MIKEFKRDGYVVVPNCVTGSPLWIEAALLRLRATRSRSVARFRAEARLLSRSIHPLQMFLCDGVLGVVRELGIHAPIFQTGIACHAMGHDETFEGTAAHQDWPALQSGLNSIAVWIPLEDVGPTNYPLEVVPGSHLMGLLPAKETEHYSEVNTDGMEFKPIDVPQAGALFMSTFLVHRTRTKDCAGRRVAFSWRYEDAADPTFQERGMPSAQSRSIRRDLITPNFPTVEQIREIYK